MSSAVDDGTSGFGALRGFGGITVVQPPNQAEFESVPKNAMDYVQIDHNLPATEIGEVPGRSAEGLSGPTANVEPDTEVQVGKEKESAAEDGAFQKGVMHPGDIHSIHLY